MTVSLHLTPTPFSEQTSHEKLKDPLSGQLLTRAVTLFPCGHNFNQDTVDKCNKFCPLDQQPIEHQTPNFKIRALAEKHCKQLEEEALDEEEPLGPDNLNDAEKQLVKENLTLPQESLTSEERPYIDESVGPQEPLPPANNTSIQVDGIESSPGIMKQPNDQNVSAQKVSSFANDVLYSDYNSEPVNQKRPSAPPEPLVYARTLSVPKVLSAYLEDYDSEEEVKRKMSVEADDGSKFNSRRLQAFFKTSSDSDSLSPAPRNFLPSLVFPLARSQSLEAVPQPKIPEARCLKTFQGNMGGVYFVQITADGKLLSVFKEGDIYTFMLWDTVTGKCVQTSPNHPSMICCLTIDGKKALLGGMDGTLKLWDVESGKYLQNLAAHKSMVRNLQINPDATRALSGSTHGTIKLWDLKNGKCLQTLSKTKKISTVFQISSDGKKALTASGDFTIKLWDLEKGKLLKTLTGHKNEVRSLQITPDGKKAISKAGYTNVYIFWDLETGKRLNIAANRDSFPQFTLDGRKAIMQIGNQVAVLDDATGKELQKITCYDNVQWKIAPDGKRALYASWDKTLRFLDLETGKCQQALCAHSNEINCLEISPDSKRALSGSSDKTLKLWDVETGRCLQTLNGHSGRINCIQFTPDGKRAFSGSSDGTVKLWDLGL